jgi:hypothetical protein
MSGSETMARHKRVLGELGRARVFSTGVCCIKPTNVKILQKTLLDRTSS